MEISIGLFRGFDRSRRNGQTINWNRKGLRRPSRAVCLSGNHDMFLAWLDNPEERYSLPKKWCDTTINSIRPATRCSCRWHCGCESSRKCCPDLVAFIRSLPFDYETENLIILSTLCVDLNPWKLARNQWLPKGSIRKPFHAGESYRQWIAFGHTLQSMDCSMSQSAPKIFGFQIRNGLNDGALALVESHGLLWMITHCPWPCPS